MLNCKRIAVLLFLAGWCLIGPSLPMANAYAAQEQPESGEIKATAAAPKIIDRASDIMAREVVNEKGVHLGYSKDLIIGKNGCIVYLVMLRGSAFGVIGPLIPVPWSMVTLQGFDQPLLIKVEPEVIEKAPGFTLDLWPDFFSPEERKKIDNYYREYLEE